MKSTKAKASVSSGTETTPLPLRLEYLDPAELTDNPHNWRTHPARQVASLQAAMAEVGWAGALLFNERTGRLIDGHARKILFAGKGKVPVLIGSWDEVTEKKILATLDPLGAMAEASDDALKSLLSDVETENASLQRLLDDLVPDDKPELVDVTIPLNPPCFTWVLIGIPTVQFGDIASHIEAISAVPNTHVEMTSNDNIIEED